MSLDSVRQSTSKSTIPFGQSTEITITIATNSDIKGKPADVVFLINTSDALKQKMPYIKNGTSALIDEMYKALGSPADKTLGETNAAVLTFGSSVKTKSDLTNDIKALKAAILSIDSTAGAELIDHAAAINFASDYLKSSKRRKVLVLITNGQNGKGEDVAAAAKSAKDLGIELFCIGIDSIDTPISMWSSEPSSYYCSSNQDNDKFVQQCVIFGSRIVTNAGKKGVENAVINEEISDDFKIVSVGTPNYGTAQKTGDRALTWNAGSFGAEGKTYATLKFTIAHVGASHGVFDFVKSLSYSDADSNTPEIKSPKITVEKKEEPTPTPTPTPDPEPVLEEKAVYPEPCPAPTEIIIEGCKDAVNADIQNVTLMSLGRIVQIDLTLKNICPNRRVALAVILSETDAFGTEHARGMKTLLIPAQDMPSCSDILVKCIDFVLPEALDTAGSADSICNERNFNARVIANYIDTDFVCCDNDTVII